MLARSGDNGKVALLSLKASARESYSHNRRTDRQSDRQSKCGETHTLTYLYTGLSEGTSLPSGSDGSHYFTAMGVLDSHVIDYYDSSTMKKVPKQPWMAEKLDSAYWEQGTQSRKSKQQWFKVNVDILLNRMGHNRTDVHVLQWLHGCRGNLDPNGILTFGGGVDTYSYDGLDFLSFDYERAKWVATAPMAVETKRKWDDVRLLKVYTRAYLDKECISWMDRFLQYQRNQTEAAPPPSLELFARPTRAASTLLLTCLASGFPRKDVILEIRRNGRKLTREDGLASLGVRPNGDGSFQRRDSVEVLQSDTAKFTCVLRHPASGLHDEKLWDGKILGEPVADVKIAIGVGLVIPLVILVAIMGWVLYRKFRGGAAHKVSPVEEDCQRKTSERLQPLL
ncbi:major histocompatibility complex class I-related gene protein-like isoform X1 [Syngnathus acus]|uniref:major histocompatibility complex class I-related gene protein-like isoform X1 n=1 Tax=Syngnathus acus TaxID=161584 RepID=UPI00188621C6|nr:major histocompatibility complex class I-related gene protein-like isoform X1 [Syngnathus acus]